MNFKYPYQTDMIWIEKDRSIPSTIDVIVENSFTEALGISHRILVNPDPELRRLSRGIFFFALKRKYNLLIIHSLIKYLIFF